jgi:heme A synthase
VLGPWIVEYGQNIYVVSVFAAVALFGVATYKSGAPRPIYQLTFVFASYFVFLALMYMLRNFSSGRSSHNSFVGFFGMWLPLGVAYVFCDPSIGDSLDRPHPWP